VDNGQGLITSEAHNSGVSDVVFSLDGSRLYSASVDGTGRTYLLDIDELMALARQRLYRQLTETECRQYLHRESCPGS
jgi:WD40 repeat protein